MRLSHDRCSPGQEVIVSDPDGMVNASAPFLGTVRALSQTLMVTMLPTSSQLNDDEIVIARIKKDVTHGREA